MKKGRRKQKYMNKQRAWRAATPNKSQHGNVGPQRMMALSPTLGVAQVQFGQVLVLTDDYRMQDNAADLPPLVITPMTAAFCHCPQYGNGHPNANSTPPEQAASSSMIDGIAIQLAPATPAKVVKEKNDLAENEMNNEVEKELREDGNKEGTCTVHCCAPVTPAKPLTSRKPVTPLQPVTPLPLTSKPVIFYVRKRKRSNSTDEHPDNSTINGAKKKLDFVSDKCSALTDMLAPRNLLGFRPKKWVTKKRSKRSIRSNKWALNLIATGCDQPLENINQAIVPYISHTKIEYSLVSYGDATVVPYTNNDENKKKRAKVDLDIETIRMWRILMGKIHTDIEDGEEQWEQQRHLFHGRADLFISRMRLIQGDRQFSPWKGSVLDSVIGAFLTQNVSDHLSSSAFMALASKFPLKPTEESDYYTCKMSTMTQSFGSITSSSMPNQENRVPSYFICHDIEMEQNKMDKVDKSVRIDKTKDDSEIISCKDVNNVQRRILEMPDDRMGVSTKITANLESGEKRFLAGALSASNGTSKANRTKSGSVKINFFDWDSLRKEAYCDDCKPERSRERMDSLDWEALRNSDVKEISETIKDRGMNNVLAGRIKDFLDRLDKDHGSLDLEWLRNVAPEKAKEYLLSIKGLGLKSVECVRLLALHQHAFPVDTNVGRICVRLGWVPLQPLPDSLQLHLLESYPILESIQKYLWPRLCTLDQRTLYELHYHMITFGKVFCTKRKPNCNACPMRGDCRHFASAWTSSRLLQGPEETRLMNSRLLIASENNDMSFNLFQTDMGGTRHNNEPIIEEPSSPEPEGPFESVIEEALCEYSSEIPTLDLNLEDFTQNLQNYAKENMELRVGEIEKAIVAITGQAASIPVPKLKNLERLRTEHQVYELPDGHPLLEGLAPREDDDTCPYLLSIWTAGETANSTEPPQTCCNFQETGTTCEEMACFACCCRREELTQTIRGTLLIPCRTANRGSFPLNGTYFQVNEVFADHQSSYSPLVIPRRLIWNLPRRIVYFGSSIPTIFRGLSIEEIQFCFSRGFICVRGFDRETRAPKSLSRRLHQAASHALKEKKYENKAKQEVAIKRVSNLKTWRFPFSLESHCRVTMIKTVGRMTEDLNCFLGNDCSRGK